MITTYYPSSPYSEIPEPPFEKIGRMTHQHCTGTQYEMIYSDDPKGDIPRYLNRSNFSLADKFRPTMVRNGVECTIKHFRKFDDTRNVYLLVPVADPSIKIGDRQVVLKAEQVRKMTLDKISQMG